MARIGRGREYHVDGLSDDFFGCARSGWDVVMSFVKKCIAGCDRDERKHVEKLILEGVTKQRLTRSLAADDTSTVKLTSSWLTLLVVTMHSACFTSCMQKIMMVNPCDHNHHARILRNTGQRPSRL